MTEARGTAATVSGGADRAGSRGGRLTLHRSTVLVVLFGLVLFQYSGFDYYLIVRTGMTVSNYLILATILVSLLLFPRVPRVRPVIVPVAVLAAAYALGFAFAWHRLPWPNVYQALFLGATLYVGSLYARCPPERRETLGRRMLWFIDWSMAVMAALSVWLMATHWPDLLEAARTSNLNSYIAGLQRVYWLKNLIGFTALTVVCYYIAYWPRLSRPRRTLFAAWLPLVVVMTIGHRAGWLGLGLTLLVVTFRRWPRTALLFCLLAALGGFLLWETGGVPRHWRRWMQFDRTASYVMAADFARAHPFGLGLEAYSVYTLRHRAELTERYRPYFTGYQNILFTAPESNFVHLLGSLGWCGVVVAAVLAWIAWRLWLGYPALVGVDRFLALLFMLFFFAGIAGTNFSNFTFWIFSGFALGIVASRRRPLGRSAGGLAPAANQPGEAEEIVLRQEMR